MKERIVFVNDASRPLRFLVAEDDPDDRFLIEEGFREAGLTNTVDFVEDGVALFQFLDATGPALMPDIILLDLNMPRMDGRETLSRLKDAAPYRHIPVVILTTSKAEEDVLRSYETGASSYITKPVTFDGMLDMIRNMEQYWIQVVTLPDQSGT
jgi:two-component system response regulator